jgi:hypothetical protein
MYSVTISSRTATESGDGFGSSPKAYMRSFTDVRNIGDVTVFGEEVLFSRVASSVRMVCHVGGGSILKRSSRTQAGWKFRSSFTHR